MKRAKWWVVVLVSLVLATGVAPQVSRRTGLPTIDPGGVTITGTGASSGDAVKLTVSPKGKRGAREVVLNIPPGTRLRSSSGGAQGMVVAGVRGRSLGGNQFTPTSEIRASGSQPTTYILEAYCAEFHKANPGPSVRFKIGKQDPVLACIFREARGLSVAAKQAAVWIYTDHVTYRQVRAKFPVTQSEWDEAQRVIRRCPTGARKPLTARPTGRPRRAAPKHR